MPRRTPNPAPTSAPGVGLTVINTKNLEDSIARAHHSPKAHIPDIPPFPEIPIAVPSLLPHRELREAVFPYIPYLPHDKQRLFHDSVARFRVLAAGSRFGKSLASAHEVLPYLLMPNTRGWIVGPSYRLAEKEFRYLLAAFKMMGISEDDYKVRDGGITGPSSIVTKWHSEAHTLTARTPANLLGEELDWLICSETACLKSGIWQNCLRMRLTSRQGIAIFPSVPDGFNEFHQLFKQGNSPEYAMWQSFTGTTYDNPHIPPEEIEEARLIMGDLEFQRHINGAFNESKGLIFPEFRRELHVIKNFAKERDLTGWTVWGGLDPGNACPSHALRAMLSPDERYVFITHEHAGVDDTPDDLARGCLNIGLQKAHAVFTDPVCRQHINTLNSHGICATKGKNNVHFGIGVVRDHLRPQEDGLGPRLVIDPSCTELISQLRTYRWTPKDQDKHDDGRRHPVKHNDHGVDALRYLLVGLADFPRVMPIDRTGHRPPGLTRILSASADVVVQGSSPATEVIPTPSEARGRDHTQCADQSTSPDQSVAVSGSADSEAVCMPGSSSGSAALSPDARSATGEIRIDLSNPADVEYLRRDRAFWAHVTRYEAYVREVKDCEMWGRPKPWNRIPPPGPIPIRAPP